MTTQVTYQGTTLEELNGQLAYVNECLLCKMQAWERKEFEAVKKDYEFKINRIKTNPLF